MVLVHSACRYCEEVGRINDEGLCETCQAEVDQEELAVPNPYEMERFRSYCPDCEGNTIWLSLVEEPEAHCENCGLFEDQANEKIKQGE